MSTVQIAAHDRSRYFEAAARLKIHPGVYCPKNVSHVGEVIELDSPARREIKRWWRESAAKQRGANENENES